MLSGTDDVVLGPRNGLSLASGGGGLDLGLMLAEPEFHTRCWVEIEEYPRQSIIAGQRAGYLSPAPIWDDVTTFDGRPFAGAFDTLLAGYPCQPFAYSGERRGEEDERHLWPDIERIIGELGDGLRWCFFENVAGHLTLGLETVLRSLQRLRFVAAVGVFGAEEIGSPQERPRVFIVAYRAGNKAEELAHTCGPRTTPRGAEQKRRKQGVAVEPFDDCRPLHPAPDRAPDEWARILRSSPDLAPAVSPFDLFRFSRHFAAMGAAGKLDQAAAERRVRRMANGMAARARMLRLLGNGVHPLAAAYAWRTLSASHGLGHVNLGAAD